jgi:predicted dehydrogenase
MMNEVRLGVIGVGGMGTSHARVFQAGKIKRGRLAAVCDVNPERFSSFPEESVLKFSDSRKLIRSGQVDAVLVATPHYGHTTIGIDALSQGLHTLVEKPISVHKADAERLIAAHSDKKVVFAAMFNQRTDPRYIKLRNLIQSGELGEIRRVNWIITDWYRTQAYYDNGGWRATWGGEGGGVLLNQCPHNLDLMQWLFGMPVKVRAYCALGKYHKIEVEDAVTAYMEYKNGATGVFITTTGEAPGTNRLEVSAERGKVVVEHGKITWTRNIVEQGEFLRTSKASFARPETWTVDIPCENSGGQHTAVLQNYVDAILDGSPLIAPAAEGIGSVELANAMLYSSFTDKAVDIPLSAKVYETHLKKLIKNSTFVKKGEKAAKVVDLSKTFGS